MICRLCVLSKWLHLLSHGFLLDTILVRIQMFLVHLRINEIIHVKYLRREQILPSHWLFCL